MKRPRTGYAYLDEPRGVLAFAHRGGAFHPEIEGLENSLAAFRHAVDLGYRYLETDVHVTRDGVLMAFHDRVLDRVTDGTGEVARLSRDEIREARIGGRENVPTLGELFDTFPGVRFNIDIKAPGAVRPLADFLAAREAWDRVLVGSFRPRSLEEFRSLTDGRVATGAHPREAAAYAGLPSGRLAAALTRGGPVAVQVPYRRGRVAITTAGLVRRAHAAGLHVHVWTIDDPAEMHELLDLGVDGLMTDRTDILRDVLVERGQWED
ncbi:glycerophosphodiester phosphodiesterase [Nocardioides guangzhouensis]|uniref:Glycerophosphodiester phosphodiesterase n=1 Tax=Nocardioides guangzhouensis TaxID=2497878 RepID=A0A4Q4ZFZ3_9ACTN|nr:glycerophosphodiester phosphodiesterase [Nocardioides guangzhouensis]RYP87100.1 glycerophosphodiester phosphodiesterase [Nocardioides guangzhouensis]